MIEVYLVPTANGQKVAIMLEELGLPYVAHRIVRTVGDTPSAAYLALNPMGKYPTIVDSEAEGGPLAVFETLAIALYLAEKAQRLVPADIKARVAAHAWAAVAASDLTPAMATQYFLTLRATTDVSEATAWVVDEAHRFLSAIDRRLGEEQFLAGAEYSYADILTYPLVATSVQRLEGGISTYKNIRRWVELVGMRPAVVRGMEIAS
ncbi:MAG: glutathione S-transferase family protein [Proteobacteria bacterium]|nr:glutathione S-transferase family protein [Pseudomonadota bacterium]MDA1057729.1 glutathione S-transferase family protein [Pseudomonadota bacterium]